MWYREMPIWNVSSVSSHRKLTTPIKTRHWKGVKEVPVQTTDHDSALFYMFTYLIYSKIN